MAGELIFNSEESNPLSSRTFTVSGKCPVRILAAGLAEDECVQLFVRVGQAASRDCCGDSPADFLWAPLSRCCEPVLICGKSNEHIEYMPGTYAIGPVGGPVGDEPTVAGDVNISAQKLDERFAFIRPASCAGGSGPDEPVVCPPFEPLFEF
jgi:hypothetical protein